MARRSKPDADKTRSAILKQAKHLFETKGYAETSIADIVEGTAVTKGALFHYFKNKEKLFLEIWESLQEEMDTEARAAAGAAAREGRRTGDDYAAFLAGCRTYFKWVGRKDYQQIVLVDGPSVLGTAGWYERDNDLGNSNTHAGIRYLAKKGHIAPGRVEATAILVHNAMNGGGFALSRGVKGVTADSLFEAFEAMLRNLK